MKFLDKESILKYMFFRGGGGGVGEVIFLTQNPFFYFFNLRGRGLSGNLAKESKSEKSEKNWGEERRGGGGLGEG